jgi:RNA-directed DNA polymerase
VSLQTPKKVRKLQETLGAKAKQEPGYRFYSLYDKVYREDILAHAFALSRCNGGAPGVDGKSFADIESYGLERWMSELKEELHQERYKPQAVRRVMIPKAGGIGERPLGIPTIRDRVVQTAAKLLLEPIFEADFDEAAHGYRPGRSALQAVQKVHQALQMGHTEVVDADVSKYFDTIPHSELMKCLARRISDGKMLHLIKMWLKVPVEERDDQGRPRLSGGKKSTQGTPQGGVISPLLANVYIHRYIKAFRKHGLEQRFGAVLVNYADDFVVLCRRGAGEVLKLTGQWLKKIGLTLNEQKTFVRNAHRETFDFLGYTFGTMYSHKNGHRYLGAAPSKKALARVRERVRQRLRPGNMSPWPAVVEKLNQTLRGWANYFCYGTLSTVRHNLDWYIYSRARDFLRRRHKVRSTRSAMAAFPWDRIHGDDGVLTLERLPLPDFANARRDFRPRAG